jgi:plastocyanin
MRFTMKTFVYSLIGALIVLGAAIFVLTNTREKTATPSSPSPAPSAAVTSPTATATPEEVAAQVTFSGTGFTPALTRVVAGDKVRFVNRSTQNVDVESDPHPAHTSNHELNVGVITPGQSKTITVTTMGTFGVHDHLNPAITAKITID